MRIGIICPYNYFRPGGVQVCVREIAKELEARGHYVRVIVPKPKVVPDRIDKNVILLGGSTEFESPFATKTDLSMSGSDEQIGELFAKEKFDVLHFHEPGAPVWGMQLLGRSRSANVGTMHAMLPEGMVSKSFVTLMRPVAKFIQPRLQVATAVSKAAQVTARSYFPDADIAVIPNGIRLSDYLRVSDKKPSKKKTILYVGRLEKRKGVRYLLTAYAKLRKTHEDMRLIIAGDGKLRESLEAQVKRLAIPDVTFKGFVSESEKVRLLQACDVYCSPALYGESFGIVLLEAMAAGAVVVCGDNPGYASVMTSKGKLSLVNPKEPESFSQRLELMLYDNEIRSMWRKWATEYVQQFDYMQVVDQYEAAYSTAVEIHKTTPQIALSKPLNLTGKSPTKKSKTKQS